jgi:diguanylate cyclase (GGDEF)-like protein
LKKMTDSFLSSSEIDRLLSTYQTSTDTSPQSEEATFMFQLDGDDWKNLHQFVTERKCVPGEVIIYEDDAGNCMYIIHSGLSVVLKDDIHQGMVLGFRGEGDLIGEMALIENRPRSASVVALEPMVLWQITQDSFLQLSSRSPAFSLKILGMLSSRLRKSDEQYRDVLTQRKERDETLEKLSQQVMRDPLTDLYNRRSLEVTLSQKVLQASQAGTQIGILMLDIDNFKQVNDTYGHPAGDVVLQTVSKILAKSVRAEDVVCRYGGEEFVIVMPGAPLKVIRQRAELVRLSIQKAQLVHQGVEISVTLSIGAALFPAHGQSGEAVLACADQALYQAKRTGRNRVVIWQDPVCDSEEERRPPAG